MLHFMLEIIIMTPSTKTRLLLRDKCKVIHSDRLYRPYLVMLDYLLYVTEDRCIMYECNCKLTAN